MTWHKASYTTEAAMWVPLLLIVVFLALKIGIQLYQEIEETTYSEKLESLDMVQEFYNYQILGEVMEEVKND